MRDALRVAVGRVEVEVEVRRPRPGTLVGENPAFVLGQDVQSPVGVGDSQWPVVAVGQVEIGFGPAFPGGRVREHLLGDLIGDQEQPPVCVMPLGHQGARGVRRKSLPADRPPPSV